MFGIFSKLFKSKVPEACTYFGVARTISAKEIKGLSCGVSLVIPPSPDYQAMAVRQTETLKRYQTFHHSAVDLFSSESMAQFEGHLATITEAYCRYRLALTTTHRVALAQLKEQAKNRLEQISR